MCVLIIEIKLNIFYILHCSVVSKLIYNSLLAYIIQEHPKFLMWLAPNLLAYHPQGYKQPHGLSTFCLFAKLSVLQVFLRH